MYLTFRNRNIDIYFKEIHTNGGLTREDEITLFTRIAKGDKSAEVEVFNKMSKFAVAVAKTYTGEPELLEDLIQEANMGVLTAISKYDVALGYRFSSYAYWWMKAYINTFLNNMGVVHPSNNQVLNQAKKIRESFYKKNHREISEYELLDILEDQGVMVNDMNAITTTLITRIDQNINEDEDTVAGEYGEFAERTSSRNDYESEIENQALSNKIEILLNRLTSREQTLVRMRFGFTTGREMDFESIADRWNDGKSKYLLDENGNTGINNDGKQKGKPEYLTTERVRQIVTAAIKKMK